MSVSIIAYVLAGYPVPLTLDFVQVANDNEGILNSRRGDPRAVPTILKNSLLRWQKIQECRSSKQGDGWSKDPERSNQRIRPFECLASAFDRYVSVLASVSELIKHFLMITFRPYIRIPKIGRVLETTS